MLLLFLLVERYCVCVCVVYCVLICVGVRFVCVCVRYYLCYDVSVCFSVCLRVCLSVCLSVYRSIVYLAPIRFMSSAGCCLNLANTRGDLTSSHARAVCLCCLLSVRVVCVCMYVLVYPCFCT